MRINVAFTISDAQGADVIREFAVHCGLPVSELARRALIHVTNQAIQKAEQGEILNGTHHTLPEESAGLTGKELESADVSTSLLAEPEVGADTGASGHGSDDARATS